MHNVADTQTDRRPTSLCQEPIILPAVAGLENGFEKTYVFRFKKPLKNLKSAKFRLKVFLVKFYTNHI